MSKLSAIMLGIRNEQSKNEKEDKEKENNKDEN